MIFLCSFVEYLIQFGEGLGREVGELDKMWENVLGRYDRAVVSLVTDTLQESQNPVEKLVNAVTQMKTPEGAKVAAEAVQKGMTLSFFARSYLLCYTHLFHLPCSHYIIGLSQYTSKDGHSSTWPATRALRGYPSCH